MAIGKRSFLAGAAATATLTLTACVPPLSAKPPAKPPAQPTTTTTTTTTTTPGVPVPMLCSETGRSPAEALDTAAAHALPEASRGSTSHDRPSPRPKPVDPDQKPPALGADQVRTAAERITAEPQLLPGSDTPVVSMVLSALLDGRPVLRTVVDTDPDAAVTKILEAADLLTASGAEIVAVERDLIVDTAPAASTYPVDDAYRFEQWSFDRFDFEDTWCASTGEGVTVAVIDSGVDAQHPDLAGKVVSSVDMSLDPLLGKGNADKPGRHGTHVAGTIAAIANNSIGTAGVAPGVDIMDVKALTSEGLGTQGFTAKAIVHAVNAGAQVINLSVGFACDQTPDASFHTADPSVEVCHGNGAAALEVASDYAKANDVVMVVAAGNDGMATIQDENENEVPNPKRNIWNVPAAAPWSLTVGSMSPDGTMSGFSTQASYVDIAGPGSDVLSTVFDDEGATWEEMSGTSMATPHVAGLVAVLRGAFPTESAQQIVARVTGSAAAFGTGDPADGTDGCPVGTEKSWCFGAGVIDPGAAIRHAR